MFADSFDTIEHGAAAKILGQLNPLLEGAAFDPASARILSHSLPFYEGYNLIEASDYDVNPPRIVSFLYKEDDQETPVYLLGGTNEPIYALNEKAPIFLNEATVRLYVSFFFHYVRGRFGRFNIVESVNDIRWREEPAPAGRKALGKMISPIQILDMPEEGSFHLRANIVFKDSLFESDVHVTKEGLVNLSNQEMLVEDIPVIDDQFEQ